MFEAVPLIRSSVLTGFPALVADLGGPLGIILEEAQLSLEQIEQVRSELAVNYLQEPQFSLTDIGALLGFAELSVFTRTFKRWFGVTPSQWRARRFV